jgi:mannosyltransferase
LLLGAWQISRQSFNQDEAATLSAIRRPFGAMLAVLGHIDAVHGAYYLLMHLVAKLGQSEAVMRAPSVLAMAGAAALVTVIGARLAGTWTGLIAGLIFASCWFTTEYAQDARPFALATFFVVLASYRYVVFVQTGKARDAAWYSLVLAICGLVNVFTLLVAVAHGVTLAASPASRARLRPYALAVVAAGALASPVALLAATEVGQVDWEKRPGPALFWGAMAAFSVIALLSRRLVLARQSVAAAQPDGSASEQRIAFGPAPLIRLSAPWLLVPAAILLITSQFAIAHGPGQSASAGHAGIWEPRYLLFCLPGAALLIAAVAGRLPAKAARVVAVALVAAAAATQPLTRPAESHNDLRAAAALLQSQSRRGDVVVFPDIAKRLITDAYPADFRRVRDIGLDNSPSARSSLYGLNVGESVLWHRLADVDRIWIITFPAAGLPARHYGPPSDPDAFCLQHAWSYPLNLVLLYSPCAH